jgi:tetratricopeptide (TPR) repeat protein
MVAITLLETATNEYEEAIEDGKIAEMIEYQDSTSFIARADMIFNSIKARLPEHGAKELAEFFAKLDSQTKAAASFEEVKATINGIIHEYEEVLELESGGEEKLDGWGYIDKIKELLDKSVAEYKEGNAQEAKALATEAYLDNYELIENDIAQENKELMEKIEIDMRVELVQMIDAGKPAADVESHVNTIKTDLETARTVVTPEFSLAVVVLASVAATILAGTLYTRRKGLASF